MIETDNLSFIPENLIVDNFPHYTANHLAVYSMNITAYNHSSHKTVTE